MPTVTGQSVSIPTGATSISLRLIGKSVVWCGSCGCTASSLMDNSVVIGCSAGNSYAIVDKGVHQTCPAYHGGAGLRVLQVTGVGSSFNESLTSGGSAQWKTGTFYLELTYSENLKHDCINNVCTNSSVYGTPGTYSTLSACQAVCGQPNCPTGQTCKPSNYVEPCPVGQVCKPINYTEPCPDGSSCVDDESARLLKECICG